ncbi:MAG: hypothetical protein HLUCCO16_17950 [Phormidium sp. OSCR]|nr:MAG: hypothetical protein HLUCCO16_17950 [Phormidium sp. OSCR]
MNKLKQQISLVSELLFAQDTRDIYAKSFSLTGKLLKEIFTLLWMIFCLVFLVFFWAGQYVRQITYNTKVWYQNQENQHSENRFADFSKSLLDVGSSGSRYVIGQAKQQLGIQGDPKPIPAIAPVATVNVETVPDDDASDNTSDDTGDNTSENVSPSEPEPQESEATSESPNPEPESPKAQSPEANEIADPFDESDDSKANETA